MVLRDIRVTRDRLAPFHGTLINCPDAGAHSATLLVFDLDEPNPTAWEWKQDGGRERVGAAPFFAHHHIALEPGETHDLIVVAETAGFRCNWWLEFEVEVRSRSLVLRLPEGDAVFTTSGEPAAGFVATLDWAWYEGGKFLPPPDFN